MATQLLSNQFTDYIASFMYTLAMFTVALYKSKMFGCRCCCFQAHEISNIPNVTPWLCLAKQRYFIQRWLNFHNTSWKQNTNGFGNFGYRLSYIRCTKMSSRNFRADRRAKSSPIFHCFLLWVFETIFLTCALLVHSDLRNFCYRTDSQKNNILSNPWFNHHPRLYLTRNRKMTEESRECYFFACLN